MSVRSSYKPPPSIGLSSSNSASYYPPLSGSSSQTTPHPRSLSDPLPTSLSLPQDIHLSMKDLSLNHPSLMRDEHLQNSYLAQSPWNPYQSPTSIHPSMQDLSLYYPLPVHGLSLRQLCVNFMEGIKNFGSDGVLHVPEYKQLLDEILAHPQFKTALQNQRASGSAHF